MKSASFSVGLLSLATLSALAVLPAPHASAQRVMSDINFQSSIDGSGQPAGRFRH